MIRFNVAIKVDWKSEDSSNELSSGYQYVYPIFDRGPGNSVGKTAQSLLRLLDFFYDRQNLFHLEVLAQIPQMLRQPPVRLPQLRHLLKNSLQFRHAV